MEEDAANERTIEAYQVLDECEMFCYAPELACFRPAPEHLLSFLTVSWYC